MQQNNQQNNHQELTHACVVKLVKHITLDILGVEFEILVEYDKTYSKEYVSGFFVNNMFLQDSRPDKVGRTYIQLRYKAPCTKTGVYGTWTSGKSYLSSHMTEDEVVKKVYVLFEQAVKHEIMEGFKFDGKIVFNPHVNFRELLKVSDKEITRD